jgi:uridine kinase
MTSAEGVHGGGAVRRVVKAVGRWQAAQPGVLVVAIDGHGGAGKSTLAAAVAQATGAALVHTDDFFQQPATPAGGRAARDHSRPAQAGGRAARDHSRPAQAGGPAAGGHSMDQYYDWRRIRAQAVQSLKAGRRATFRRFDWERGAGLDGAVTVAPAALIVLEGVFSAAPELSDLMDRSVLVDTPEQERLRRLRARVTPEEWDPDWLIAEQAYFGAIRPPSSFDLVVSGMGINPPASGR